MRLVGRPYAGVRVRFFQWAFVLVVCLALRGHLSRCGPLTEAQAGEAEAWVSEPDGGGLLPLFC